MPPRLAEIRSAESVGLRAQSGAPIPIGRHRRRGVVTTGVVAGVASRQRRGQLTALFRFEVELAAEIGCLSCRYPLGDVGFAGRTVATLATYQADLDDFRRLPVPQPRAMQPSISSLVCMAR
jgi:hypothetical protein